MGKSAANRYRKLKQEISALTRWGVRVVRNEFPLFLLTLVLWGTESLRDSEGLLRWDADSSWMNYFGRICLVYVWAFGFAALVQSVRWKGLIRTLLYGLVLTPVCIAYFLRANTGMDICPTALQVFLETNLQEVLSFAQVYLFTMAGATALLLLLVCIAALIIVERLWQKVRKREGEVWTKPLVRVPVLGMLVAGILYTALYAGLLASAVGTGQTERWTAVNAMASPRDPVSKIAFSLLSMRSIRRDIAHAVASTQAYLQEEKPLCKDDSLDVVFVLGESYIRSHSAIYGYRLPTTPNLLEEQKAGNLVCFADAATPASLTILAIREIFFTNTFGEKPWHEGVYFPAVFKAAGFNVAFFDNQTRMETGAVISGQGYTVLNAMFHPAMAAMAYDIVNNRSFNHDGDLWQDLTNKMPQANRHFVLFHLKGQHFDAKEMFPHTMRFVKFQASDYANRTESWMDDAKRQHIADYDNATLYNDHVMKEIFNYYRNRKAVVIYVSDHGEEVYDYRDQWGRITEGDARHVKLLHRVPLMVWVSDKYRKAHPERVQNLRQGSWKPFMIDDIAQLAFSMGGIETCLYIPQRDPTHEDYQPKKRILLDGRDFDEAVK